MWLEIGIDLYSKTYFIQNRFVWGGGRVERGVGHRFPSKFGFRVRHSFTPEGFQGGWKLGCVSAGVGGDWVQGLDGGTGGRRGGRPGTARGTRGGPQGGTGTGSGGAGPGVVEMGGGGCGRQVSVGGVSNGGF